MTHVQNKSQKKHTAKGFTLLEMILVIGLISILLALFVPMVSGYLTRSRLNSANSTARVLFNSAQTVCQEFEFFDRNGAYSEFYGTKDVSSTIMESQTDGDLFFRVDNGRIVQSTVQLSTSGKDETGAAMSSAALFQILTGSDTPLARLTANPNGIPSCFQNRMNRLVEEFDQWCWAIYIHNYQVYGVVCASSVNSEYLGCYPNRASDKSWGRTDLSGVASIDDLKAVVDK